jgi:hypothetical protein
MAAGVPALAAAIPPRRESLDGRHCGPVAPAPGPGAAAEAVQS